MKKVLIIDTNAGNLFSLNAAIERLGFVPIILNRPNGQKFDAVVIPGQGRFGTVMDNLSKNGWVEYLSGIKNSTIPILGICVGMQVFFEASEEDPNSSGLGWLKGKAKALDFPKKPMVGWANLTSDIWQGLSVYFVNSYAIQKSKYSVASCLYGENFCAAVKYKNFTGVQFHPEKSAENGAKILSECILDKKAKESSESYGK